MPRFTLSSLVLSLSLAFLPAGTASAQTFEEAAQAYQAGDYTTALAGLREIALGGNADAQLLLGTMLFNGEGVEADYIEGLRWFKSAADAGNPAAAFALASAYRTGAGTARNDAEARRYFERDRKSTRLNSSHANISYAVVCLKKNNPTK